MFTKELYSFDSYYFGNIHIYHGIYDKYSKLGERSGKVLAPSP